MPEKLEISALGNNETPHNTKTPLNSLRLDVEIHGLLLSKAEDFLKKTNTYKLFREPEKYAHFFEGKYTTMIDLTIFLSNSFLSL